MADNQQPLARWCPHCHTNTDLVDMVETLVDHLEAGLYDPWIVERALSMVERERERQTTNTTH